MSATSEERNAATEFQAWLRQIGMENPRVVPRDGVLVVLSGRDWRGERPREFQGYPVRWE